MFELTNPTPCRIVHVNVRDELHGSDHALGIDVAVTMTTQASALAMFDEELPNALYFAPETHQDSIEGVQPVRTAVRCKVLKPAALLPSVDLTGRNVTVHRATTDLVLPTCKVGKFTIDALEGGSVKIGFRVQCSNVDPELVGEVCGLLQQDVDLSVVPSEPAKDPADHLDPDSTDARAPGAIDARDATQSLLDSLTAKKDGGEAQGGDAGEAA